MIDFLPFLKIAPLFMIALMSPGPDFMLVSSLSLARGRMSGFQGALGIAGGIMVYTALSMWGLGLLFQKMVWLMMAVKIAGGLYLCYLGFLLWRSTLTKKETASNDPSPNAPPKNHRNAFIMGLLTNLANPKAIAFFASVFALALTPDTTTPTKLATVILCTLMTIGWFGFVAFALSTPRLRNRYQQWSKAIDRVCGSLLLLFGLKLVFARD